MTLPAAPLAERFGDGESREAPPPPENAKPGERVVGVSDVAPRAAVVAALRNWTLVWLAADCRFGVSWNVVDVDDATLRAGGRSGGGGGIL